MPDDLLSIGELARAGSLPVSALRYYDAAGVLRPAHVDPATGYRWYTPAQVHTARLVASLRQAGLPVADLAAVLAAPHDADTLLAQHRRRLEEDLAAAEAHLDAAADLLAQPGRGTVVVAELLSAVAAVRHAVGADPDWPGLAGVLLHLDGDTLRLVGCDRYRLAVATVPVRHASGPNVRAVAPLGLLDEVASATLPEVGTIAVCSRSLDLFGLTGDPVDAAYPDYERLLVSGGSGGAQPVTVSAEGLAEDVEQAGDVVSLRLDRGQVRLGPPGKDDVHGFSRSFLLDAVRAARAERLSLAFDDGLPLSITPADRPDDVGLVMPIRLNR